ncbi:hypothetical protein ACIA8R_17855 [Nonomuraea sp. NPDC051191]|uniref:hypothetical protein n=1 Tax=Nonomuraea sp. NPDC051191 TaxID=3364372 RepID=UPI0037A83D55
MERTVGPADTAVTRLIRSRCRRRTVSRPDEKPQAVQNLTRQRGEESGEKGPVLGCESHSRVSAELAFKDGDLVTQNENFHVPVPFTHGQQSQRGESQVETVLNGVGLGRVIQSGSPGWAGSC